MVKKDKRIDSKGRTRTQIRVVEGYRPGVGMSTRHGHWVGSVVVGYKADGKPDRKHFYGKTRGEVAQKVAAMTSEVFANGYTTVSSTTERNFQVLMQEWFDVFGENPKIVVSLMGHKKVSTTLDLYSHVVDRTVYEKTAQTLGGLFK